MLKIEQYTSNPAPLECNFKKMTHSLIYDEMVVNGLITKEYYYSDENKTDLVIQVDINYVYGADTLVEKMTFDVHYYNEEDQVEITIPKIKVLTARQKMKLLKARRKTVRIGAEATCLGLMQMVLTSNTIPEIMAIGGAFLLQHDQSLDAYEKVGSPQIVADIGVATDTWLDATPLPLGGASIRQYLQGIFSV